MNKDDQKPNKVKRSILVLFKYRPCCTEVPNWIWGNEILEEGKTFGRTITRRFEAEFLVPTNAF